MSPWNLCHSGTNYLTEKYVGPTLSLGIVVGERIPSELSPATSRYGKHDSLVEETKTESNVWDDGSEDVNPFDGGNPLLTKETESEPIIWDIGDEEEEYPFVNEYPRFGGEEDNIKDVVVANDLCFSMIQIILSVDFEEDITTKSHELMSFGKSIIIKVNKTPRRTQREFRRLRRAAWRLQQKEYLAIAGRNIFDDEASSSNNIGTKPPTSPKTLHEHPHPNSSGFQNSIILPAEQAGRIIDSRDILLIQGTCNVPRIEKRGPPPSC
nr:hypothetical protein [Tanacetum cinerariifolium]